MFCADIVFLKICCSLRTDVTIGEKVMRALVFGGTSSIGLELALLLREKHDVWVAGRRGVKAAKHGLNFLPFYVDRENSVDESLNHLYAGMTDMHFDLIVCATGGFYRGGTADMLSAEEVSMTLLLGLELPIAITRHALLLQGTIPELIIVGSISQYRRRDDETVYSATKAGLNMYAKCLALDSRVGKMLMVAPAQMRKDLEDTSAKNLAKLDPRFVAAETIQAFREEFRYLALCIYRNPPHAEVIERSWAFLR